ncbi:MAG: hypothetical protein M1818_007954 [Claussenomyces sp. TS43310]|nr:MAG: hypothetical protein M1818_007954 [Claussenomyces sp. TS43310]
MTSGDSLQNRETLLDDAVTPTTVDDVFADINWPEEQEGNEEAQVPAGHGNCFDQLPDIAFCVCENKCSCRGAPNLPSSTDAGKEEYLPTASDIHHDVFQSPDECSAEVNGSQTVSDSHPSFRFSKEAKSILRIWYNEHKESPYPTSEEKDELAARTKLKRSQISLWLANTRRRYRSRKAEPSQPNPRAIPPPNQPKEDMNPFERWKVLPLDEEATAAPVILSYVAASSPPAGSSIQAPVPAPYAASTFETAQSTTTQNDYFWTQSMASFETGPTSLVHGSSLADNTIFSHSIAPSVHSQSSKSLPSGRRRRRNQHMIHSSNANPTRKDRPFQCTFCPNTAFSTKYDWQRHEKSQHLSLERWTCCMSSGTVDSQDGPICAFCGVLFPDTLHLEKHHYLSCHDKDLAERTFYRKDHFQQHLRLTHATRFHPRMEVWKSEIVDIKSRCGFCNARFYTWSARTDHLASHFKCHADMKDWSLGLGLEPHIAALVERSTRVATSEPPLAEVQFAVPILPRSRTEASDSAVISSQHSRVLPYDADRGLDIGNANPEMEDVANFVDYNHSDILDWAIR